MTEKKQDIEVTSTRPLITKESSTEDLMKVLEDMDNYWNRITHFKPHEDVPENDIFQGTEITFPNQLLQMLNEFPNQAEIILSNPAFTRSLVESKEQKKLRFLNHLFTLVSVKNASLAFDTVSRAFKRTDWHTALSDHTSTVKTEHQSRSDFQEDLSPTEQAFIMVMQGVMAGTKKQYLDMDSKQELQLLALQQVLTNYIHYDGFIEERDLLPVLNTFENPEDNVRDSGIASIVTSLREVERYNQQVETLLTNLDDGISISRVNQNLLQKRVLEFIKEHDGRNPDKQQLLAMIESLKTKRDIVYSPLQDISQKHSEIRRKALELLEKVKQNTILTEEEKASAIRYFELEIDTAYEESYRETGTYDRSKDVRLLEVAKLMNFYDSEQKPDTFRALAFMNKVRRVLKK